MLKNNAKVFFNDNYVKELNIQHKNFSSRSLNYKKCNLKKFDLVILVTDHDYYEKNFLINNSKIIFDARFYLNNNKKVFRC